MCNLQKRLIRAAFWVLLQAMFMNNWKQTAQRLKLQERLLTIKKRNIIRWKKIYTEKTIFIHEYKYLSVYKNPESSSFKLKFMFLAGFPVFAIFKDELEARKFLLQPELFNNYSSSPNGLWVNSPWGRRPNGLLTQRPWGREE